MANASNTVSLELVRLLLPPDWFAVLDCFRSKNGATSSMDYKVEYNMFCSMGNAFCFELESLIFKAIAIAAGRIEGVKDQHIRKGLAIFGDDLVTLTELAPRTTEILEYFGFSVNEDKSYFKGNFFESCGADYFKGQDVRPFFLKRSLNDVRDCYFFCNSILYFAMKRSSLCLLQCYKIVLKFISNQTKILLGPLHFQMDQTPKGNRLSNDDLEATLRVPLAYAQKHKGVSFDINLQCFRYRRWVLSGVDIPLSLNSQKEVNVIKYLLFLKGSREGRAVYKNRVRTRVKTGLTSHWDGNLSYKEVSILHHFFQHDVF
jgi:hypothetical protein